MAFKPDRVSCLKTCLIIAVFSFATTSCSSLTGPVFDRTQTGYYYGRGLNNIEELKFPQAIASLSEGLKDYRNSGLLTLRGYAFCKVGKYQEAVDDFNLALKYRQSEEYNIASINRHLSKTAFYKEPFIYANRGLAFSYLKDFDKASLDIDRAIEIEPSTSIWYCFRALNQINMENYQDALLSLNKSIELDPDNPVSYHIRAMVFEKLNQSKMALKDIETQHTLGYKLANDITKYSIKNGQHYY